MSVAGEGSTEPLHDFTNLASSSNFIIYAAIAQSVERILGKDEVASSNLASSSKTKRPSIRMVFFVLGMDATDLKD